MPSETIEARLRRAHSAAANAADRARPLVAAPRKERCLGPAAFGMLRDRHITELVELVGGDAFTVGDVIHVCEMAGEERYERLTGREIWLRVTGKERLTKALPTGLVVLTVELLVEEGD